MLPELCYVISPLLDPRVKILQFNLPFCTLLQTIKIVVILFQKNVGHNRMTYFRPFYTRKLAICPAKNPRDIQGITAP